MKPKTEPAVYDESKITTLSSLEHIRLRPGMYIGRLGNGDHPSDGIYILVKEIIDNAIDEHIMGHGKRIDIEIHDKTVKVRDFGRGIPLGKIVECVSIINTGAKYNDEVFQFSIGLNGVGTKAVNALSSSFQVAAFREGKQVEARFEKGILQKLGQIGPTKEVNGTLAEFIPDSFVFGEYIFNLEFVRKLLWNYAYLNSNLTLVINGEKIRADNGLLDLINKEVGVEKLYEPIHCSGEHFEFAFTHTDDYGENYFSFVNGHYTSDGGTHLSCFRESILKAVNEYFKASYQSSDVRDGILGAVAIKLKDPIFESQTKNKLGNTDLRGWLMGVIKDELVDYLFKNRQVAEELGKKIQSNERLRKELADVKKAVRDRNKKSALTIPQLKDCKIHFNDKNPRHLETTIFLTEGQSAGGSMVSSRDVMTQSIFCLKGKPLNCWKMGRDVIYKNEELYNIMKALGIEENVEDLRYNKIVLATDADVDGLHIRNLLLTFFLHYFESLVLQGHVYILETPLFRVRNQKKTVYCYSEAEKDKAADKMRGDKMLEITRFKGLGEISPKEFGPFIGNDIRLVNVEVEHVHEVRDLLTFYMGKNTEERKQYIMDNLI